MADDRDEYEPGDFDSGLGSEGSDWNDVDPIEDRGDESIDTDAGAGFSVGAAARALGGVIALGVAVVVVAGASLIPLPTLEAAGAASDGVLVQPSGATEQRACAGPPLLLGSDPASGDLVLTAQGTPRVALADADRADELTLQGVAGDAGGAASLVATTGTEPFAGAQSAVVSGSAFAGLVSAGCVPARTESWLVGGSTDVGRTTLVLLANPTDIDATVRLEAFGDRGSAGTLDDLSIAAGSMRAVSLAAFAGDVRAPVVRVTSTGGRISAQLQSNIVRAIVAGGVETTGPTADPASTQTVTGVTVVGAGTISRLARGDDFEDAAPVLRLGVPGIENASVRLTFFRTDGPAGEEEGGADVDPVFDVPAGSTRDLPLDGLANGTWSIRVEADVPVVAAARTSVPGAGTRTDLAWFVAPPTLRGEAAVAVADGADGGESVLALAAGQRDARVRLLVRRADGDERERVVEVAAGEQVAVGVQAGAAVRLETSAPVTASIAQSGDGQLASYPVLPPSAALAAVRVHP